MSKVFTPIGLAKYAFPQYKWGKMHFYLQEKVFQMLAGKLPAKRLIIETPPQHYKSSYISQLFLSWLLITDPTQKLILLSYSSDLAQAHSKIARDIVSEHGEMLTGCRVDKGSKSKGHWYTSKGGYLKANSLMGGTTGTASTGLVIDDALKGSEDAESPVMREKIWQQFCSTAETRLHPDGFIIVVMTRWHPDDLVGRILQFDEKKEWTRISLPALAHEDDQLGRAIGEPLLPERYSLSWYQDRKKQFEERGLDYQWNALYDCDPTGDATTIEWAEYLKGSIWCDADSVPRDIKMRCLSLDPSKSARDNVGDYSAFCDVQLDREHHLYVRSWLQRVPADRVISIACNLLKSNRYDMFIIETNMLQSLFADAILKECQQQNIWCPIIQHQSKEDKVVRIRMSLTPLLAQKRIHLLTDSPSNKLVLKQLREFSSSDHDDGCDALQLATVAINHLLSGKKSVNPTILRV